MLLRNLSANRGKITPGMMLVIAAIVIALAAGLFLLARQHTETKKMEHFGEVGMQSRFTLTRETGMNLPYADQAKPAPASEATTIEAPLDWGKDVKEAEKKINDRYIAIASKLTLPGGEQNYDETITLVVDRDLEYKTLVQAILLGNAKGFNKYQIACHPKGETKEVGYLKLDLPVEVPEGKNQLLFRLMKETSGTIRYVFGTSKTKECNTLQEATALLKNTADKGIQGKILVLMPSLDLSVQNVVEALNGATYAGFPTITLSKMKVE